MLAFTIRRLLSAIPILLVSTFAVFLLIASSVDPLSAMKSRNPPIPRAEIAAQAHKLFLDRSGPERYWHWLWGLIAHGDFGISVQPGLDINAALAPRFFVTLRLILAAILVSMILAVVVGVVTAVRQYSRLDYTATLAGFLFLSLPTFWFAILLKNWAVKFNDAVGAHPFQTLFDQSTRLQGEKQSFFQHWSDVASHLVLPTIVLSLTIYASWARFQRASMLDVLNSDYMRLARAKGLSRSRVMVKHGLRTALIPLTTQMALDIAGLLGGVIITERIFQWNGMGTFFLDAINAGDANALMGFLIITSMLIIVFNLIADLLYAVLDPRIRLA
jgi:peptide/nickel transport system permease protein